MAIAAGAPHALRLSCFATCAVVGVAFGPLNIQLTDAYGNPLPSADLPLRLTVRRAAAAVNGDDDDDGDGGDDGEELECELIDSFCKASAAGVRGTAVVQLRVSNATPGPIRVKVSSDDGARVPLRSASVSLQLVSGLSYYAENPVVSRCLEERSWAAAMLKHGPSLLWTVHAADVPFNSLSRGQLVNHFPSNPFTTKVGIADCLRNSSRWLADADPASFFPRCYDLSDEALAEFTSDFHRTAASAVLERFVAHGAAPAEVAPTSGFVPLRLASAALQVVGVARRARRAAFAARRRRRGAGGAVAVVLAELATFAATPEPSPAAVAAAARGRRAAAELSGRAAAALERLVAEGGSPQETIDGRRTCGSSSLRTRRRGSACAC